MARYEFDDKHTHTEWTETGTRYSQLVVRAFGFVLMLVGLWITLAVIAESWSLYQKPANIERLARAIEHGSNLDHALSRVSRGEDLRDAAAAPAGNSETELLGFRMSYFVAWIIAILLLLLVGRLALGAVKAGGELVLYDVHIKKFARELARESLRARSGSME